MYDKIFEKIFNIKVKRKYIGRLLRPLSGKRGYCSLPDPSRLPKKMREVKKAYNACILQTSDFADDVYAQRVAIKYLNRKIGYGVFAKEDIPRGILGMYAGELKKFNPRSQSRYLFSFITPILEDVVIDGSRCGNWTAFMNHSPLSSKETNVLVKEYFYNGLPYILFFTPKKIKKGTQLLYDYGSSYWESLEISPETL